MSNGNGQLRRAADCPLDLREARPQQRQHVSVLVALVREPTLASDVILFTVGFGNLGVRDLPASVHPARCGELPPRYGCEDPIR